MPQVEIEVYEVCLGTGIGDAGATVMGPPFRLLAAAEKSRDEYMERLTQGVFDPVLTTGKTFYVRVKAGAQSLPISAEDKATILLEIAGQPVTLPLYVRTKDGANTSYVRIAEVAAKMLAKLEALLNT